MHILQINLMHTKDKIMRTTLDLPEELIVEAMELSKSNSKTSTIVKALETLIRFKKMELLADCYGKADLDIDLDVLRKRNTYDSY